jgi:16S rRNA G966 N2-methylase RsmD
MKNDNINDIYKIVNVKGSLRALSDEHFEIFLPEFCEKLVEFGFDQFIQNYNNGLQKNFKDWNNLKNKKIEKDWINSTSVVGLNIIKRNMPHIYEVCNYKGLNIKQMWDKSHLEKALRANRKSHPTPYVSEIVRQLGFTAGTTKITIYRPLLTKRIVEELNGKNVLDVCVGWGGRMLGTASIDGVKYTGIEPFSKTFTGLEKIKKELKLDGVTLYNDIAENALPNLKKEYDLALTSPPYYNLELYSNEKTQSHNYGSYEDWIDKFLKPVVHGVLDKLIDTGYSCWSVKNFKTDKKYNLYDDVVKIHKERGWIKIDREFYVGNCIRPGSQKQGKEITYVFVKE